MPKCERTALTEAQIERLAILAEECGEVVQVVGKILRHGLGSHDPNRVPNTTLLEKELGDIFAAVDLLAYKGELRKENILCYSKQKLEKLQDRNYPFVHFQSE